ncbi:uncharacterized protein [Chelonus insularis]|uniref:uncharacterized protein n=1 Tax=Chelonus insularis TaxID=460826 RepID=UPI00158AFDA4|nr:uncharacterized protein LOC118073840 [Chelonus insularis]
MIFIKVIFTFSIFTISCTKVLGHGMAIDPVGRGSAWRQGFKTPENWNDNENFCGGYGVHYGINKGKCGACGDDYSLTVPRPHENGGLYGTGTIVRTYKSESIINATIQLTASHLGYFEFALCPLENEKDVETEDCFERYPLRLASGGYKYPVRSSGNTLHTVELVLPQNLKCKQCSFRWHYRTGNTWGICPNGKGDLGCGNQETFRTCSDIAIE